MSTTDKPAARGRPSAYSQELADHICERLAGGETLRAICRDEGMPDERTVRRWALDDVEGFPPQYARAREIGYHSMADEMVDIADDTRHDTIRGGENEPDRADHEWISRSRLRVDTRKWLLSKALPKVYGDKLTAEVTGKDGAALNEPMNMMETARQLAFIMASAAAELDQQGNPAPSGAPQAKNLKNSLV